MDGEQKYLRIAFGCEARVGKDTSAAYLANKLNEMQKQTSMRYETSVLSFAEPLYNILHHAQRVCGFEIGKDRKFLQWVGTDWARSIKSDVWVNLLVERIGRLSRRDIIVTDVRFIDEFEALKKLGFVMVRLIRTEKSEQVARHASETSAANADLPWDHIIDNNGTLEELYAKLDQLFFKSY